MVDGCAMSTFYLIVCVAFLLFFACVETSFKCKKPPTNGIGNFWEQEANLPVQQPQGNIITKQDHLSTELLNIITIKVVIVNSTHGFISNCNSNTILEKQNPYK